MKYLAIPILLLFSGNSYGQSFDLLRINRFLEPSITIGGRYEAESISGNPFHGYAFNVGAAIPLTGKVSVKTDIGKVLDVKDWKDILGVISLDVRQLFFNFDAEYYNYGFLHEASGATMLRTSVGLSGFRSLRKRRFLIWGARATFAEQPDYPTPVGIRASASAGAAKFAKIGLIYYYGAYLAYSDGKFFGTPWLGAQARIPGGWRVKILLPTEARLSYRFGSPKFLKRSAWEIGAGVDSRFFRTGAKRLYEDYYDRSTVEYGEFRFGGDVSVDISRSVTFSVQGGTSIFRKMRYEEDGYHTEIPRRNKRPYVEAELKLNLKRGWFDIDLDKVLF